MEPARNFLRRCFPLLFCESLDELIECSALIPDFKNAMHLLRMGLILLILFLTLVSGLKVETFKGYSLRVNDSLGSSGQIVLLGTAAFMSELVFTRIWFYSRYRSRRMQFIPLANQMDRHTVIKLMIKLRVAVINVLIVGTSVMLSHMGYQFINESTTQGKIMLIIFFTIWCVLMILNGNDMLIMYFLAYLGLLVIRGRLVDLRCRLNLIPSCAPDVVFEVAHLRRSMITVRKITQSVQHLNSLVMCLMATNRLVVAPAASIAVYLFILGLGHGAARFVQIHMAICFAVYVLRGYTLTFALAIVSSELRRLHSSLASMVAHRHVSLFTKIQLLQVMQNLNENSNRFVIRDTTGPITHLDVLESILVTLQFTVLLFDFGKSFQ